MPQTIDNLQTGMLDVEPSHELRKPVFGVSDPSSTQTGLMTRLSEVLFCFVLILV